MIDTVQAVLAALSGTAEGVEPDGALRLRLASGELRRIAAGDVFFGEAA